MTHHPHICSVVPTLRKNGRRCTNLPGRHSVLGYREFGAVLTTGGFLLEDGYVLPCSGVDRFNLMKAS